MAAKAPLEFSRKPVLTLEVGCCIDAAVYIEKGNESDCASKLAPRLHSSFSACFARLRSCAPRTSAWVRDALGYRRFFCGKNERKSSPLRRRDSEARSFRRSETAFPRGRCHTTMRQADHAARDRARETGKKKDLKTRDELARTFGFRSFFR